LKDTIQVHTDGVAKWIPVSLEVMGVVYVAMAFLFLMSPDSIILWANKAFSRTQWPVVFFPTERFWYALAWSVPGTRAFLVFAAARRPHEGKFFLWPLQISLLIAGAMFAFQFFFRRHAPLYALGCVVELGQVIFFSFLGRKLPDPAKTITPLETL